MLKLKIIRKVGVVVADLCLLSVIGITGCVSDDDALNGHWETDDFGKRTCEEGGNECEYTPKICDPRDVSDRIYLIK
jgi:hypothetical protein